MSTKNCANVPKSVLKDLCEKSFVRNVLYSANLWQHPAISKSTSSNLARLRGWLFAALCSDEPQTLSLREDTIMSNRIYNYE